MIQANLLLSVSGKQPDSFGVMDPMRLPLGILTGIGFIGAGAIVRRGQLITGVTTAATLWIMTVIGLCFGGGELGLGVIATLLTLVTLRAVKWVDVRIPREQHAVLIIGASPNSSVVVDLAARLAPLGYETRFRKQMEGSDVVPVRLCFEIRWRCSEAAGPPLDLVKLVNANYAVAALEMTPEEAGAL